MGRVYTGVAVIEGIDMRVFSYNVCDVCNRKPRNARCHACADASRAPPLRAAYMIRARVRVDDSVYKAVLFDSAARMLLGYRADQLLYFVERAVPEGAADVERDDGLARVFIESAVRGTVIMCELESGRGTDLTLRLMTVLSASPHQALSSVIDNVLNYNYT